MVATVNITISPLASGTTEVFKNNISLEIVSSTSTFTFNINDTIKLSSTPNINYEFSHYTLSNENESTEPIYEDTITTEDVKNVNVIFESISDIQRYSCIEGICEESESGNFTESTCNNTCIPEPPIEEETDNLKNILLIVGVAAVAWTIFRSSKED